MPGTVESRRPITARADLVGGFEPDRPQARANQSLTGRPAGVVAGSRTAEWLLPARGE